MTRVIVLFLACCLFMPGVAAATDSSGNACPEGSAVDCNNECNGSAVFDDCGVCDGQNAAKDDCGICFGGNRDMDSCGVCFGNNEAQDVCGVCFGNGAAQDCEGNCFGGKTVQCGICAPAGTGCVDCPYQSLVNGMLLTEGCIPSGCETYTTENPTWALVAINCPQYAGGNVGLDWMNIIPGTLCGCIRSPQQGCFPPEARILTVDGERRIDSLKVGDRVINPLTGNETEIIKVVQSPEKDPLVRFGYRDAVVTVTQTHPVYTSSGVKKADELVKGDSVLGADGEFHVITDLQYLEPRYGQQVYNLVLDTPLVQSVPGLTAVSIAGGDSTPVVEDNLLLSDGIVTGDMAVQILLNQD